MTAQMIPRKELRQCVIDYLREHGPVEGFRPIDQLHAGLSSGGLTVGYNDLDVVVRTLVHDKEIGTDEDSARGYAARKLFVIEPPTTPSRQPVTSSAPLNGEYERAIYELLDHHHVFAPDGTARHMLVRACNFRDRARAITAVKALRARGLVGEQPSDINGGMVKIWRLDRPDAPIFVEPARNSLSAVQAVIAAPPRLRTNGPTQPRRSVRRVARPVTPPSEPAVVASIPAPRRGGSASAERFRQVLEWLVARGGTVGRDVTARTIAELLGCDYQAANKVLNALAAGGYIERLTVGGRKPLSMTVLEAGYGLLGLEVPPVAAQPDPEPAELSAAESVAEPVVETAKPMLTVVPDEPASRSPEDVLEWFERLRIEQGVPATRHLSNFAEAGRQPGAPGRQFYLDKLEAGLVLIDPPAAPAATA